MTKSTRWRASAGRGCPVAGLMAADILCSRELIELMIRLRRTLGSLY